MNINIQKQEMFSFNIQITRDEVEQLKSLVQNPFHGEAPDEEDPFIREFREKTFFECVAALKR